MNIKSLACYLIFIGVSCFCHPVSAKAIRDRAFTSEQEADNYLTCHYNRACKFYSQKDWKAAATELERVVYFFPKHPLAANSYYYLATCYFNMKEYDFANVEFSNYLHASEHPEFFEETIYYKFCIAEYFREGKKIRLGKLRYTPKLFCAKEMALTVYDEIIMTVPNHELAAASLYSKGWLLRTMGEYRDSIDAFQSLIRRFPKHELAPQAYLNISQAYFELSQYEFQNPDLLALADLNVRKFKEDFPRDDKVCIAEEYVCKMKEMYAKGLSDLGSFYERVGIPSAAAIYYESSISEFPDTQVAQFCRERMNAIGCEYQEEREEAKAVFDMENSQPVDPKEEEMHTPMSEPASHQ